MTNESTNELTFTIGMKLNRLGFLVPKRNVPEANELIKEIERCVLELKDRLEAKDATN